MRLPRPATRLVATLGLITGLITSATGLTGATSAGAAGAATTTAAAGSVPRPDHVVVVLFENTSQGSIIGNSSAPYFNQLANTGANFTNSFAIEHPSEPNYLDLFSGSNQGITDDSCPHTFGTDNEGAQLIAKGLTFAGYSEDLPSTGSTVCTSGKYARKHNPWVNFSNVPAADNKPFSAFPTDFTQLPTVSWVVPNLCNDIHDCSIATGDSWFKSHLDSYVQWAKTHNSVLITTFDEDDSAGNNQIATLVNGQPVKTGSYGERIDHFSVLRTIEDMYGLPYAGAAAQATPITDAWSTGTTGSVTVTAPGNQTATVGTAASLQLAATDTAGGTLTWTATGLPAGLTINAATGKITGTPTTAGTTTVTATATDSTGPSGSTTFSWTVNPVTTGTVTVTAPGNQTATVGTAASLQLAATDTAGGTLTWTATGLPAGLTINAATGKITGTPTTAGTTTVTATATDSTGPSGSTTFSWTVNPVTTGTVTVTAPGNQTATVGTAASLQLAATDTAGGTLTWTATGLPAGLTINAATGKITGTPTTAGTTTVTATATDSTGPSGSTTFSWTVNPVSTGCTPGQLLGNSGFETGSAAPWTASSGVVNSDTSSQPTHAGSWDAWLDGYGSSHTDTLAQTVTIPAGCKATLSFWLHIDTAETGTTAYDKLTLLANTTTLASYSNVNAAAGYVQRTFDLSAFAGKSVTLKFTGVEDSSQQTSFVIDDTALNVS